MASTKNHVDYEAMKDKVVDKTWDEKYVVRMYMLTRRPRPMHWMDPYAAEGSYPNVYHPQFTEHGSLYYEVPVAAFKKFKSGEDYKYFLGTNCKIQIQVPNGRGGSMPRYIWPVVEQVIKQGAHHEPKVLKSDNQDLPILVPVYDNQKESILKDDFINPPDEIKV